MLKFKLGSFVKDIVTGYSGKITAACHYLYRPIPQYLIESVDSTGRPIEWWVEENRLEEIENE